MRIHCGQHILDSALIANVCIEEYRRKNKRGLVVKLDLGTGFFGDRYDLEAFWGQRCLSTSLLSMLLDVSPRVFFSTSIGLRQGDGLSPFLLWWWIYFSEY